MEPHHGCPSLQVRIWLACCLTLFVGAIALLQGCWKPEKSGGVGASSSISGLPGDILRQTEEEVAVKNNGCVSCHTQSDAPTMHLSSAVRLACVDCHGGQTNAVVAKDVSPGSLAYDEVKRRAHIQPRYPEAWSNKDGKVSAANPKQSYTLLNKEDPEFIRFVNPGDLRVARLTCGACHQSEVEQVEKSPMTTSGVFWTAAAYNNGIVPQKTPFLGESYSIDGVPQKIEMVPPPTLTDLAKGVLPFLLPLPRWEVLPPGDIFRVFERGGSNIPSNFPDIGTAPSSFFQSPSREDPGRPDIRQSNRGPGTGLRIAVPVLNIHKTRLNDPHLSFLGTNDNPGDFRSSGCTACHVVYANDRDPFNSGPYAKFGNRGESQTKDPTIPKQEAGHPLRHQLTKAIPTSQCMSCHMHQPNVFVNSYLGYTMWDYESDGEALWPEKQKYPTEEEKWSTTRKSKCTKK